MIYLHKLLPWIFLPIGMTLILVLAGLILRRAAPCWAGIVVLWLMSTPIISNGVMRIAEDWQVRRPVSTVPPAQAIVVLSSARVRPPGDPQASEWTDADRFYGGVELYKAGKGTFLIFTGGWSPWEPTIRTEGEVLADYAVALGVPRDRILVTDRVSSTEEESVAVARLHAQHFGPPFTAPVTLVTSAFHMRRAQLLFARAGISTEPYPVDFKVSASDEFTPLALLPNAASLFKMERALRELYGLAYYHLFRE